MMRHKKSYGHGGSPSTTTASWNLSHAETVLPKKGRASDVKSPPQNVDVDYYAYWRSRIMAGFGLVACFPPPNGQNKK